ncbi:sarcosine oxidase subunit delta, partial [Rhizobium ruizarguesonis]
DNPKGLIFERWRNIHGCGRFFNAARDTVSDNFIVTYKAGEPKPAIGAAAEQHVLPVLEFRSGNFGSGRLIAETLSHRHIGN